MTRKKKIIITIFSILTVILLGVIGYFLIDRYYVPPQVWKDRDLIYFAREESAKESPKVEKEMREFQNKMILDAPDESGKFSELDEGLEYFFQTEYKQQEFTEGGKYIQDLADEIVMGDITVDEAILSLSSEEFNDERKYSLQDPIIITKSDKYFYVPSLVKEIEKEADKYEYYDQTRVDAFATFYDKETNKTKVVYISTSPIVYEF